MSGSLFMYFEFWILNFGFLVFGSWVDAGTFCQKVTMHWECWQLLEIFEFQGKYRVLSPISREIQVSLACIWVFPFNLWLSHPRFVFLDLRFMFLVFWLFALSLWNTSHSVEVPDDVELSQGSDIEFVGEKPIGYNAGRTLGVKGLLTYFHPPDVRFICSLSSFDFLSYIQWLTYKLNFLFFWSRAFHTNVVGVATHINDSQPPIMAFGATVMVTSNVQYASNELER
jgi:hypothetical protein